MNVDSAPAVAPTPGRMILAVLLTLAACASDPQPPSARQPPTDYAAEEGIRPGVPLAEILASAYEERENGSLAVLDRLAEPARVERRPVENRYVEGQIDTLRTLVYDGLQLDIYETAQGKQLLQEVRVTGRGYETSDGIQIGSRRSAVRKRFGTAVSSRDSLVYLIESSPEDPASTTLRLRFKGNDLAAMTWSYYVD